MAGLKSRKYYDELTDLVFSEQGDSKRANKIFDILERRGFPAYMVEQSISAGRGLPEKEDYKKGGMIKRKGGSQLVKKKKKKKNKLTQVAGNLSLKDKALYKLYNLVGKSWLRPGKDPNAYSLGDAMFDASFKVMGIKDGGQLQKKIKRSKKKPRGWGIARYNK